MKYLILSIAFVTILFSCSNSNSKKTSYEITDWMVSGVTNPNTGDGGFGWAKMVIYKDSSGWKLNSNGDTIRVSLPMDTFYIVQTPDYSCPVKDSTGKQINNPQNHQPMYYTSWRTPSPPVAKNRLKAQQLYPEDVMKQMLASQAVPDTAYHSPSPHITIPANPTKPTTK